MTPRREHANLCVNDIEGILRFLMTAFPEFRVRRDATGDDGKRWVHAGTEETYIAVNPAGEKPERPWKPYEGRPGVNHLAAAGFRETTVANAHPHRTRVYFVDGEGNDWEFVQYRSADHRERNGYALPDR